MSQLLTCFRDRIRNAQPSVRRRRGYQPDCGVLEDRCLLTVTLTDSPPAIPYVGAPVVWTASVDDEGTTPVYQFSVGSASGATQVVQDFSASNTFTWVPMQEGIYNIQVVAKSSYDSASSELADSTYTAETRTTGTAAVITATANPLVALFSVPPSPGGSVYVQYSPDGPTQTWADTSPASIVPGESTNILVAGMLPDTPYLMRYVLDDGTASAPEEFTTGTIPSNLSFPTITDPTPAGPGNDPTQSMILNFGVLASVGAVDIDSANLQGKVNWYYTDPTTTGYAPLGLSQTPGGNLLVLAGNLDGVGDASELREIDLAGDTLHQTDVQAINTQLTALGDNPILDFNHDAELLPNGDTAVIAHDQKVVDLNGTPTMYLGDEILVLNQSFQVVWDWDAFNNLNTNQLPTLGEGPADWLHANSVAFSPEDGDLIVSLRSQDQVIKIDYDNGLGDGHVVWTLGAGGDFTVNSTDPSPWFSHQHDVTYVNDNTIVLFDDGNTRRAGDPTADSRGQEWIINEQTMTATLEVNVDLGDYSPALGSAQRLPNGNFGFTSGDQSVDGSLAGQTIEVTPEGTPTFVEQVSNLQYRGYFVGSLYGPTTNLYDNGFEDPPQGSGPSAYTYDPTGSAWSFQGTAGLAGNSSLLTSNNPSAPQGSQVAFLQMNGSINQIVTFTAAGSYVISLSAAQGSNINQEDETVSVLVDGKLVESFTPSSTNYVGYVTNPITLTAGNHSISFAGVATGIGGGTALLDDIGINNAPPTSVGSFGSIDLSSVFNRVGIVTDGSLFIGGDGIDDDGNAFSAQQLGSTVTAGGDTFNLGPANSGNAVAANGQTIALSPSNAGSLSLLALGVNGNQQNQVFVVNYTDGTTATFTQSLSDWFTPQNYAGESIAASTAYRDTAYGVQDARTFNVYQYTFALDPTKQVASVTLPTNSNVVVLAASLIPTSSTQVDLSSSFNRVGIVTDGSLFIGGGGIDNDGDALSAQQLGSTVTAGGDTFNLGPANSSNAVAANGQTIALTSSNAGSLSLLALGVNGNQQNQVFVVNYTDGTTATFTQSFSDWLTPQNYAGESIAATTAYRDTAYGGQDARTFNVYQYTFALDPTKQVASITLPTDSNVVVLAINEN